MRQQPLHGGHQKGRRLAGAGLCLTGDVPTGKRQRQRFRLDRCTVGKTGVGETVEDALVQFEAVETDICEVGLGH